MVQLWIFLTTDDDRYSSFQVIVAVNKCTPGVRVYMWPFIQTGKITSQTNYIWDFASLCFLFSLIPFALTANHIM